MKNLKYQTWTKLHLLHFSHVCFNMFLFNVWGSFGSHEAALKSVDDIGWHKICWRNISKIGFQNTIFAMSKHAKTAINCSFKPAGFVFFIFLFPLHSWWTIWVPTKINSRSQKLTSRFTHKQWCPAYSSIVSIDSHNESLSLPRWICYWYHYHYIPRDVVETPQPTFLLKHQVCDDYSVQLWLAAMGLDVSNAVPWCCWS